MDLHLTSEQTLLRDSATKFIAAAGAKAARSFREQEPGFAPARLRQAAELGWFDILVPEQADGLALGLTELALVAQQLGQGLVCEPVGFSVIAAAALAQGDASHPMLKRVTAGEALVVPALEEGGYDDDPFRPGTCATGEGRAVRVTGRKTAVCASGAEGFLVSATGAKGPVLCYVKRDAAGVTLDAITTVDGRTLATLNLSDAPGDRLSSHPASTNAVEALHSLALFSLSAELLGVMEKAQDMTLDYMRIRKQFGKLIGSFQALQHQAADLYIRTEMTRSLVFQIAANNDAYSIDPAMAAAVKSKASENAMAVTKACIQLHGAIGYTDEHDIGLYLKRAMLLTSLLGNSAAQRRRYVALAGLTA